MKSLASILLVLFWLQSCSSPKGNPYLGVYKIDTEKSQLGKYSKIDSIINLQLIIKSNQTFEYSRDMPFVFCKKGKWNFRSFNSIDSPPVSYCYFNNGNDNREDVLLPLEELNGKYTCVYFQYPLSKENEESVSFLCFTRIE